jgi:hypothetical protein
LSALSSPPLSFLSPPPAAAASRACSRRGGRGPARWPPQLTATAPRCRPLIPSRIIYSRHAPPFAGAHLRSTAAQRRASPQPRCRAVVGAPTPESSVAALTVPPGWLDRVVHNRIHGRRGLIWKQPVMSSMAGPPMAGAQCEGGRSSHA